MLIGVYCMHADLLAEGALSALSVRDGSLKVMFLSLRRCLGT